MTNTTSQEVLKGLRVLKDTLGRSTSVDTRPIVKAIIYIAYLQEQIDLEKLKFDDYIDRQNKDTKRLIDFIVNSKHKAND